MREWHLLHGDPMAPRISADARSGRTHYADDQTWQLRLGAPDEPALSLETRYGGRVGLARVIPMWVVGRRQVYETQGYHAPPALTTFAPDFLRVTAGLTLAVRVTYEFWTMESQAVGGRVIAQNTGNQPQVLRFDLAAQVAREGEALQLIFLSLDNGQSALQLGRLAHFQPVLLLEGGQHVSTTRAELSRELALAPGQTLAVRWVLAALPERDASLGLAHRWLAQADWEAQIAAIERRLDAQPDIETGRPEWDLALAWSQQLALRSFLGSTGSLPHPSFVSSRRTNQGLGIGGTHSGGFTAPWGGQTVPEALLLAGPAALTAPELAKGVVRNFLAVQRSDGWIDAKPGLDGQRANVLAPPLLATLAEQVYRFTQDREFLASSLDGLIRFFERWFQPDVDRDGDGVPEWAALEQGAFANSPVLAQAQRWAQGVDVSAVEAPDLVAYVLHDGQALLRIAQILGREDVAGEIEARCAALETALVGFWDATAGVFHYRDRDAHTTPAGTLIFSGKGDQSLSERTALPEPGRLILRVTGGLSHKPALSCTIEGMDAGGKATHETVPAEAFDWYRGVGSATSDTVWSALTYLRFSGLSRVFKVDVTTLDLTRHDQALLMPLWAGAQAGEQVERTVALLTDPARYWRAYGVSGCPASDPAYDASAQNGCGGVWPSFNARLGWALLERGYRAESAELFRRLLAAQLSTLRAEQTFRALYNPDTGQGMGDAATVDGIVALGWFADLFGAYALNPAAVVLLGPFAFEGETMTWTQHGVRIQRSAAGTEVRFASGRTRQLPVDAPSQVVRDDAAPPMPPPADMAPPAPPPQPSPLPPPDEDLLPDGN